MAVDRKRKAYSFQNITQPEPGGYQVRIVRRQKETSRYFSFRHWGSERKAFIAANHWRDMMKVVLKKSTRYYKSATSKNKSTGIAGISRYISWHKRKQHHILSYSVCWKDATGKSREKTFQVCYVENYTEAKDLRAFEVARQFREDWEHHADEDILHRFNPDAYLNWQRG